MEGTLIVDRSKRKKKASYVYKTYSSAIDAAKAMIKNLPRVSQVVILDETDQIKIIVKKS
jgi:hypothetical protein